jgi:hypothetical protein
MARVREDIKGWQENPKAERFAFVLFSTGIEIE